jgi:hypothetical protein
MSYVIVTELDKMRLFYLYYLDQIWTFNLVYIYADWSFCYLTYNVFSFYGLSYSMTYDMTPLRYGSGNGFGSAGSGTEMGLGLEVC